MAINVTEIDAQSFFADMINSGTFTDPETGEEKSFFHLSASEAQQEADPENAILAVLKGLSALVAFQQHQETRIAELKAIVAGGGQKTAQIEEWVAALNANPDDEEAKAKLYEVWHPNLPLGGKIIDDRLDMYVIKECFWVSPGHFRIEGFRVMDDTGRLSSKPSKIEYARLIEDGGDE